MATASNIISSTSLTLPSTKRPSILLQPSSFLKLPATTCATILHTQLPTITTATRVNLTSVNAVPTTSNSSSNMFYGLCYVVRDDVDTDQIIPTEYRALNPSDPEDYKELGSHALMGLPPSYALRFVEENGLKSKYSIIIAGNNFGCGSLGENAIVALGAAGARAVVAQSYDGVFFKNSGGQIFAFESEDRICEEFKTGDVATIDVGERILINRTIGKVYHLKALEDVNRTPVG